MSSSHRKKRPNRTPTHGSADPGAEIASGPITGTGKPSGAATAPALQPARNIQKLSLSKIRRDPALQSRESTSELVIAEYAEALLRGETFPSPVVFKVGKEFLLTDGFHTLAAAERAGLTSFDCEVRPGTRRDAMSTLPPAKYSMKRL